MAGGPLKVVVVGATGNVGTALLDRLAAEPAVDEVVGLTRRQRATGWPKTTFHRADQRHDDLVPHLAGADAVVHVAWLFQPTHRPTVAWSVNVGGTAQLLDAVVTAKVPVLLYASSVGAYSRAHGHPVDESSPTDGLPTAAYGREKAYAERLLDVVEARHPERRVVRFRSPACARAPVGGRRRWRPTRRPAAPTSWRPGSATVPDRHRVRPSKGT